MHFKELIIDKMINEILNNTYNNLRKMGNGVLVEKNRGFITRVLVIVIRSN
ncbi:hypothetical protein B0I22_1091 [Epilithonimonas xixisoli]|uniref:Uncharacterized protein n=1 Tax=Epilithonimonas xixisoli TaxID=1476462 RepID=A0A4R8IA12_9FLAO|nr:hypothetical protein B0I22_1091 [Epilithonimonas xixisoli]